MASIAQMIADAANAAGLDPNLAISVASQESGLNQNAVSPKGAIGMFQLMPATAAALGVNPYDLADNIRGGVMYLSQLLSRFGDVAKALAGYNFGPTALAGVISRWGMDWLAHVPAETQAYVSDIMGSLGQYVSQFNPVGAVPPVAVSETPPAPETQSIGVVVILGLGALALLLVSEALFE